MSTFMRSPVPPEHGKAAELCVLACMLRTVVEVPPVASAGEADRRRGGYAVTAIGDLFGFAAKKPKDIPLGTPH